MNRGLLALALSAAAAAPARDKPAPWQGAEMPLQLSVRTPQDLAFKAIAERQYLIFNLLAAGKVAWDAGDPATAAARWEQLLALPGLDPQIDKIVRPLAAEARKGAGGKAAALPPPPPEPEARREEPKRPTTVTVSGLVNGGGASGPGGAVIVLRRTDGAMPRPAPARGRAVLQKDKSFVPRVLAVPIGSTVTFRNEDPLFHNVFSLSPTKAFDTGLYKAGGEVPVEFDKAGVVQLLCNIHSSMIGYVVVVDSPYYAQADGSGAFSIRGVPPGEYDVEAWHENASAPARQKLTVGKEGAKVALSVGADRQPPAFPPDKHGTPRQPQLGY